MELAEFITEFVKFVIDNIPEECLESFLDHLKSIKKDYSDTDKIDSNKKVSNTGIETIVDRTAEWISNIESDDPIDKVIGMIQIIQEGKDLYAAIIGDEEESTFEVNEYKIILDTARYAWDSFSESYNRQVNGYDYVHVIPKEEESEEDESNEGKEEKRYRYVEDEMSM